MLFHAFSLCEVVTKGNMFCLLSKQRCTHQFLAHRSTSGEISRSDEILRRNNSLEIVPMGFKGK